LRLQRHSVTTVPRGTVVTECSCLELRVYNVDFTTLICSKSLFGVHAQVSYIYIYIYIIYIYILYMHMFVYINPP